MFLCLPKVADKMGVQKWVYDFKKCRKKTSQGIYLTKTYTPGKPCPISILLQGFVWKVSKYGVFSGPHFPVFGLNTRKHGVFPGHGVFSFFTQWTFVRVESASFKSSVNNFLKKYTRTIFRPNMRPLVMLLQSHGQLFMKDHV